MVFVYYRQFSDRLIQFEEEFLSAFLRYFWVYMYNRFPEKHANLGNFWLISVFKFDVEVWKMVLEVIWCHANSWDNILAEVWWNIEFYQGPEYVPLYFVYLTCANII